MVIVSLTRKSQIKAVIQYVTGWTPAKKRILFSSDNLSLTSSFEPWAATRLKAINSTRATPTSATCCNLNRNMEVSLTIEFTSKSLKRINGEARNGMEIMNRETWLGTLVGDMTVYGRRGR